MFFRRNSLGKSEDVGDRNGTCIQTIYAVWPKRKINHELLHMSADAEKLSALPSLRERKYIYEASKDCEFAEYLLFSDQAVMGITEKGEKHYRTLYELMEKEEVSLDDFHAFQVPRLQWLIQNHCIIEDERGGLRAEQDRVMILKILHDREVVVSGYVQSFQDTLDQMENDITAEV